MIYGSVCSGVEAATVAWHPLGWKAAWFSQYDPEHNYKNGPDFPSKVLAHHYPEVPNLGDMMKIEERPEFDERTINLLVGGTPCQSFSIAGLRKGLDDSRGNLALKFCQILIRKQPRWFVWENVPGVLSSNSGRDFAAILSGFRECGYGFAYRILDAQYFGVAQRRRRVFVVGYLGDWRPAGAVLFERESLYGNPAPSRSKGQGVTGTIAASTFTSGAGGRPAEAASGLFPVTARKVAFGEYDMDETASTVCARDYKSHTDMVCFQSKASASQSMNPSDLSPTLDVSKSDGIAIAHIDGGDIARTLTARHDSSATPDGGQNIVACFKAGQGSAARGIGFQEGMAPTLTASDSGTQLAPALLHGMAVRHLTPIECERLQGFPDNYTRIPINSRGGVRCRCATLQGHG